MYQICHNISDVSQDWSKGWLGLTLHGQGLHGLPVPRWLRSRFLKTQRHRGQHMSAWSTWFFFGGWSHFSSFQALDFFHSDELRWTKSSGFFSLRFSLRTGGHSLWRPFVFFSPSRLGKLSVMWACLKMLCTPFYPMVLLIIIPFLNGYFIGKINPTFSDKPMYSDSYAICGKTCDLRSKVSQVKYPNQIHLIRGNHEARHGTTWRRNWNSTVKSYGAVRGTSPRGSNN